MRRETAALRARLAAPLWAFDGWPFLLALWEEAREEEEKIQAIEESLDILPPLPRTLAARIAWPDAFDTLLETPARTAEGRGQAPSRSETIRLLRRNEGRLAGFFREGYGGGDG